MQPYLEELLSEARAVAQTPLPYRWTGTEERVLSSFFTNLDRHFAFMHGLPPNVGATVLSMYSRMQNPRGIRGVFVDSFLPGFLASALAEVQARPVEQDKTGKPVDQATAWLKEHRITSLDGFVQYSREAHALFREFVRQATTDPDYIERFGNAEKAKIFLAEWLDKYGHNSIARMASLWLIAEEVSILLAKTFEWCRPGFGAVELSTRYVKMSKKGRYPIARLLAFYGVSEAEIETMLEMAFDSYQELAGEKTDGPFPNFLREHHGRAFADAPEDLRTGVFGETSDVLANLLPCGTLTSLGMSVSGESFGALLKHLYLDNTPESIAAAEAITLDSSRIGGNQFARHFVPTPWEIAHWQYLRTDGFGLRDYGVMRVRPRTITPPCIVETVENLLDLRETPDPATLTYGFDTPRGEHDKLPPEFEAVTVPFKGAMSFRGWRDLQRQGLSTHARTRVSTKLAFYRYDKPAPKVLREHFDRLAKANRAIEETLLRHGVPPELREYVLSMGWLVGFTFFANLRQWEFCSWQRSSWSVNHEVRQIFLSGERSLRELLGEWWVKKSRADMTPAYIFARGTTPRPLVLP